MELLDINLSLKALDAALNNIGQSNEKSFRSLRNYPQYKYFTRPIYKLCVNNIGTVAATGIAFLAADLILHQFGPQILLCLASQVMPNKHVSFLKLNDSCNLSYDYGKTLIWAGFAVPVMYAKYKRACAAKSDSQNLPAVPPRDHRRCLEIGRV